MTLRNEGWAKNSPIREAEHRRDLRWARFVFFAQAAVGLLFLWAIVIAIGVLVVAFTPDAHHGF